MQNHAPMSLRQLDQVFWRTSHTPKRSSSALQAACFAGTFFLSRHFSIQFLTTRASVSASAKLPVYTDAPSRVAAPMWAVGISPWRKAVCISARNSQIAGAPNSSGLPTAMGSGRQARRLERARGTEWQDGSRCSTPIGLAAVSQVEPKDMLRSKQDRDSCLLLATAILGHNLTELPWIAFAAPLSVSAGIGVLNGLMRMTRGGR
jgi:hypothetical protein